MCSDYKYPFTYTKMGEKMKENDLVIIKGEKDSLIYKIINIKENLTTIKGLYHRIIKYENLNNLELAPKNHVKKEKEKNDIKNICEKIQGCQNLSAKTSFRLDNEFCEKTNRKITNNKYRNANKKYLVGKILHIDGDNEYLEKCLELYNKMGIYSYGKCIKEEEMPQRIKNLLLDIHPDVVVITGHDLYNNKGIKNIDNYLNSKYFIATVKEIRNVLNDSCVIIAGACQSNYDALIASGANYASSPRRINVHTFDPAIIAIKTATTSFLRLVDDDMFKYIENGKNAYGGVQTFGKMKILL